MANEGTQVFRLGRIQSGPLLQEVAVTRRDGMSWQGTWGHLAVALSVICDSTASWEMRSYLPFLQGLLCKAKLRGRKKKKICKHF